MTNLQPIVDMIRATVIPSEKPAVCISGGLDSTIILHHLKEKFDGEIYTYTLGFGLGKDEFKEAKRIADLYKTVHKEIIISDYIKIFPEILKHFSRPRFNLYPWWLAKHAKQDGMDCLYVGEGCDEHFGGYYYKNTTYLQNWADHMIYIMPAWEICCDVYRIKLFCPFTKLDWSKTEQFYNHVKQKTFLRKAYEEILPDFVVNRRKVAGPMTVNWKELYERELSSRFSNINNLSKQKVWELFQQVACEAWLVHRRNKG